MKNRSYLIFIALLISYFGNAQDTSESDTSYWFQGGLSSLTFSNISLSNWASGGQNSSSVSSYLLLFADRQKNRSKWRNSMDIGYGLLKQGDRKIIKSDDKLNVVTQYGYQVINGNDKWYITGIIDFRSQFTPGYSQDDPDSVISQFMAPGYLTIGSGIEYSPNKQITFGYKPVTEKLTIVTDDKIIGTEGAYGVEAGKNVRTELGSYFNFSYKNEIVKNVKFDTKLELFTNYEADDFGNIDVNWQSNLIMRINDYMTTNLFAHLLYDDDIKTESVDSNGDIQTRGARTQFKNVFGIGLAYHFGAERIKDKKK